MRARFPTMAGVDAMQLKAVQALCADAGDAGRVQQMNQAGGFACLIHLCCCSYM